MLIHITRALILRKDCYHNHTINGFLTVTSKKTHIILKLGESEVKQPVIQRSSNFAEKKYRSPLAIVANF